jgi:transposase
MKMKATNKNLKQTLAALDELIKDYKDKSDPKNRDWKTYEQQFAARLQKAFVELKPLINEAIKSIKIIKTEQRGKAHSINLEQRVLLILLKHLIGKSNRNMSVMLVVFSWLTNISVSYKTIERLYSDEEVILTLNNLYFLMLRKKGITQADACGDGTGYSLSIKENYCAEAQKLKDKAKGIIKQEYKKTKFIYSFTLIDLKTRFYIAYGTSFRSEKEAFDNARKILEESKIELSSVRLDKYYSAQIYAEYFEKQFPDTKLFLIPKNNATIKGSWLWKRTISNLIKDPVAYLTEYYQRNQSESSHSEDKKRTGWKLGQKREDRVETANTLTVLWHNLYWLGGEV